MSRALRLLGDLVATAAVLLLVAVAALFGTAAGVAAEPLHTGVAVGTVAARSLAIGALPHLARVAERAPWSASGLIGGIAALAGFVLVGRFAGRGLWPQVAASVSSVETHQRALPAWRDAWATRAAIALVFLAGAGIGLIGTAHQVAWLLRAPVPLTRPHAGFVAPSSSAAGTPHDIAESAR